MDGFKEQDWGYVNVCKELTGWVQVNGSRKLRGRGLGGQVDGSKDLRGVGLLRLFQRVEGIGGWLPKPDRRIALKRGGARWMALET